MGLFFEVENVFKATGTGKLSKGLDKASMSAKGLGGQLSALKVGLGALGIGIVAAGVANLTKLWIEQERVVAQLQQRLKTTGGAVGLSLRQIRGLASELQTATGIANETIEGLQGQLLTFTNVTGERFERATELILDLGVAMGQGPQAAVLMMGKLLNDLKSNLGAASQAGIQFSDQQKAQIKALLAAGKAAEAQTLVLDEMEKQFGGSARAARDTMGGALKALKEELADLGKEIGGVILIGSGARGLTEFLIEAARDAANMAKSIRELVTELGGFGGGLAVLRSQFATAMADIVRSIASVISAISTLELSLPGLERFGANLRSFAGDIEAASGGFITAGSIRKLGEFSEGLSEIGVTSEVLSGAAERMHEMADALDEVAGEQMTNAIRGSNDLARAAQGMSKVLARTGEETETLKGRLEAADKKLKDFLDNLRSEAELTVRIEIKERAAARAIAEIKEFAEGVKVPIEVVWTSGGVPLILTGGGQFSAPDLLSESDLKIALDISAADFTEEIAAGADEATAAFLDSMEEAGLTWDVVADRVGQTQIDATKDVVGMWLTGAASLSELFSSLGKTLGRALGGSGQAGGAIGGAVGGLLTGQFDSDAAFGGSGRLDIGALAGQGAQIGALVGPVGAVIGAVVGAAVGVIVNSFTDIEQSFAVLSAESGRLSVDVQEGSGQVLEATNNALDIVVGNVQGFLDMFDAQIIRVGELGSAAFQLRADSAGHITAWIDGVAQTFDTVEEAINALTVNILTSSVFTGLPPQIATALANSAATTVEQLQADISLAMIAVMREVPPAQRELRQLVDAMLAESDAMRALGLSMLDATRGLLDGLSAAVTEFRGGVPADQLIREEFDAINAEIDRAIDEMGSRLSVLVSELENAVRLSGNTAAVEIMAQAGRLLSTADGTGAALGLLSGSIGVLAIATGRTTEAIQADIDALGRTLAQLDALRLTQEDLATALRPQGRGGQSPLDRAIATLGVGTEQLRGQFEEFRRALARVADAADRGRISEERLAQIREQSMLSIREQALSAAASVAEALGLFEEQAEFEAEIEAINHALRLFQLIEFHRQLLLLGPAFEDLRDRIAALIEVAAEDDSDGFVSGDTGGLEAELERRRQELEEALGRFMSSLEGLGIPLGTVAAESARMSSALQDINQALLVGAISADQFADAMEQISQQVTGNILGAMAALLRRAGMDERAQQVQAQADALFFQIELRRIALLIREWLLLELITQAIHDQIEEDLNNLQDLLDSGALDFDPPAASAGNFGQALVDVTNVFDDAAQALEGLRGEMDNWERQLDRSALGDPLAQALFDIDVRFASLIERLNEAGASAEELARAEQLASRARNQAFQDALSGINGVLAEINDFFAGPSAGGSINAQISTGLADLRALSQRAAAGDTGALSGLGDAASQLIALAQQRGQGALFALLLRDIQGLLGPFQGATFGDFAGGGITIPAGGAGLGTVGGGVHGGLGGGGGPTGVRDQATAIAIDVHGNAAFSQRADLLDEFRGLRVDLQTTGPAARQPISGVLQ